MRGKISMDLSFCQSETGFSLDELIVKLADVYERKAFPELLKMILQMIQEILLYRIFHGKTNAMKCCSSGHLRLNGSFERRIRTSLGEFKMTFWRVSCSGCGKSFSPLQRFIRLDRYQTKTNELQNRLDRFDSGPRLHFFCPQIPVFAMETGIFHSPVFPPFL